MKEIQLGKFGKVALVDDWRYDELNAYKWHAVKSGAYFTARTEFQLEKIRTVMPMHHMVLNIVGAELRVVWIDGNRLNNQIHNLIFDDRVAVCRNKIKSLKCSVSKYKGVFRASKGNWRARIWVEGKVKDLGSRTTQEEAAALYDAAAKKYFKTFAQINDVKHEDLKPKSQIEVKKLKGSSLYVGVSLAKRENKWVSRINYKNKTIYLGSFSTEIDAAEAYNNFIKKHPSIKKPLNIIDYDEKQKPVP